MTAEKDLEELKKELKDTRYMLDDAEKQLVQVYERNDMSKRKIVIEIEYYDLGTRERTAQMIIDRIMKMVVEE